MLHFIALFYMLYTFKICSNTGSSKFFGIFYNSIAHFVSLCHILVVVVAVHSLSGAQFLETPRTSASQASVSFTIYWSLLKVMSIELVMPSNHLILWHPLLLWPSVSPSITVFSNESALRNRWLKYWSFSFSICPSSEYSGLISFKMTGLISMESKGFSRVFSSAIAQKHQFFGAQLSLWSNPHIRT